MGKILASFLFFVASSGLAVHEARPRPRPPSPPPVVDDEPPPRVVAPPPWVRYAPPPQPTPPPVPPPAPPRVFVPPAAPTANTDEPVDVSEGDVPDAVDRCPDDGVDVDGKADDDGCPEVAVNGPSPPIVLETPIY